MCKKCNIINIREQSRSLSEDPELNSFLQRANITIKQDLGSPILKLQLDQEKKVLAIFEETSREIQKRINALSSNQLKQRAHLLKLRKRSIH